MNIFQKIFYKIAKFYLVKINNSDKIRDLIMWPITSRVFGIDYKTTIKLKNRLRVKIGLEDMLNRFLLYYSSEIDPCWEPQTTHLVRDMCKAKKNIVVAGAHIGYMFLELVDVVPDDCKIYAFEPVDYLFNRSNKNIKINNLEDKVFLSKIALSDKSGEVEIYNQNIRSSVLPLNGSETAKKEKVEAITLKDFQQKNKIDNFDLIFLDIEGFELNVLKGAHDILVDQKPDIIFEVSPKILKSVKMDERDIYKYLESLGYSLYLILDNYKLVNMRKGHKKNVKLISLKDESFFKNRNDLYFNILAVDDKRTENLNSYFDK